MINFSKHQVKDMPIFIWLFALTTLTFFLISIGGITRLTESGLSMVDWRPVLGILPPLKNSEWIKVFEAYKNSPEFIYINQSINLIDFKYIFWWEWFHRFLARFIGLIFIIPLIFFVIKKKISKKLFFNLLILFIFGLFQALVGWWMVKSGLNQNPYVSAYRLAFHLGNAIIILSILFWLTLNAWRSININYLPSNKSEIIIFFLIALLFVTMISGAFMAGTHAGQSFNTYPLMDGVLIPNDYFQNEYGLKNIFENTVAINFNHRWLATFTFILIITFTIYIYNSKKFKKNNFEIMFIFIFSCLQFLLGLLTLLTNVELILASLHQMNSMFLLISILLLYHTIKMKEQ